MKTLIFSTDFSANAKHAAEYGYNLAKQISANIILCNSVVIPAAMPEAAMVAWPLEEYDVLMDESSAELEILKMYLEQHGDGEGFKPAITCLNEAVELTEMVNGIIAGRKVDMVVMGTHKHNGWSDLILGSHSNRMIDVINKPLLLVPPTAFVKQVKKIAFATDFKYPEKDLETLYKIIPLAQKLNAEILLVHICDEKEPSPKAQEEIKLFLTDLSNKANYPYIYYRIIKNNKTEGGLDWLCEHGQIDMLAMVHREHGFFDSILKGSHTVKMADHITIPLLVLHEE